LAGDPPPSHKTHSAPLRDSIQCTKRKNPRANTLPGVAANPNTAMLPITATLPGTAVISSAAPLRIVLGRQSTAVTQNAFSAATRQHPVHQAKESPR
jgi:hypothetical protein